MSPHPLLSPSWVETRCVCLAWLECASQVYSSAAAYQAALPPSAPQSCDEEGEDREGLCPLPPTPTPSGGGGTVGGGPCGAVEACGSSEGSSARSGRKGSGRMVPPSRSPSEISSTNTSPAPTFFKSTSGGLVGGAGSAMTAGALSVGATAGSGGVAAGGGVRSTSSSPRAGGLPELLRQVKLKVPSGRQGRSVVLYWALCLSCCGMFGRASRSPKGFLRHFFRLIF